MTRRNKKTKRRLIFISMTVTFLIISLVTRFYHDFTKIIYNKKETIKLSAEYDKLVDEQKKLTSEVAKMKDPGYIARYAKEKYLYSSNDEIIIRMD